MLILSLFVLDQGLEYSQDDDDAEMVRVPCTCSFEFFTARSFRTEIWFIWILTRQNGSGSKWTRVFDWDFFLQNKVQFGHTIKRSINSSLFAMVRLWTFTIRFETMYKLNQARVLLALFEETRTVSVDCRTFFKCVLRTSWSELTRWLPWNRTAIQEMNCLDLYSGMAVWS